MRRWPFVLMVLVLTGCAATLSDSRRASIRNLAAVSAVGDEVTLTRIFGGEEPPERVDWRFDEIAVEVAADAVRAANPAISIVPVDYDANALAAGIHRIAPFESYADPVRIEADLRRIVEGKTIDTILLIARSDHSQGALLYVDGVGLLTERTVLPAAPITPYAALSIFIIDVPTMKVAVRNKLWRKGMTYNVKPLIEFEPMGGPAPFLPGFVFPMTEEQKAFARPLLEGLVRTATADLMRFIGF